MNEGQPSDGRGLVTSSVMLRRKPNEARQSFWIEFVFTSVSFEIFQKGTPCVIATTSQLH